MAHWQDSGISGVVPTQRRIHAALQAPPRSGRACVSGALQGDPGGARRLLEGIGALRGAQSGAGETGAASGRLAVEQLCHDGRQGGVAGVAIDRVAARSIWSAAGKSAKCLCTLCRGKPRAAELWTNLQQQIYLGSDDFIERLQSRLPEEKDFSEVPKVQRRIIRNLQ
jgi:hypothetical protein